MGRGFLLQDNDMTTDEKTITKVSQKIDPQTAAVEFARFLDYMELEQDESTMSEEELLMYKKLKQTITKAIEIGRVTINEDGSELTQHVVIAGNDVAITFVEPSGQSNAAMDTSKDGHYVARLHKYLAEITKRPPTDFSRMKRRYINVSSAIATLFLA